MKPLIIVGGIGVLAWLGLKAKRVNDAVNEVEPKFTAVKWNGFSDGSLNIDTTVKLLNPTATKVNVNYLFMDVTLPNGQLLTSIEKPNWNKVIAKENTTDVIVPVKVGLTNLASLGVTLFRMIRDENKVPDKLKFKGYIKVNEIPIKFDEEVKVL
jgi:hypothetical protein